jgi:serine/threonine-protein kinase
MTKTCRGCGREFLGSETYCPDDGFRLTATDSGDFAAAGGDPLVGVTLDGRYKILRVIGEGGMGVVYEALHVVIEKPVAVKVLRDTFTSRPDVVERFRQEAKSASRIGHPNIIDVSDFGETPTGASYIVMEMLTGEDLADILARERVLSPARATRIVYQVARALDATHRKGIVHRDLKPENIYLISVDGVSDVVKVVDFGVAKMSDLDNSTGRKLTRTGMLFGTPEYMSPEQAAGKPFDHRVDVYALGAIFFELLTGRVPFEGENFMEVLAKHGSDRVPTLSEVNSGVRVSYELERIVGRALCKDPTERYQTMGELANDLRAAPEMPTGGPNDTSSLPDWALIAPAPVGDTHSTAPIETAKILPPPLPRTQRSSPRAIVWTATAAIAVVLGVGTYALRTANPAEAVGAAQQPDATHTTAHQPPSAAPVPAARTASSPPSAAPRPFEAAQIAPSAEPPRAEVHGRAAETANEPGRVELLVRTEPAGARLNVFGKDTRERCKLTPCSVSIPRGQPVRIRAVLGGSIVRKQVSFAENGEIELRFASANHASLAEERDKDTAPSDLKVPALFR